MARVDVVSRAKRERESARMATEAAALRHKRASGRAVSPPSPTVEASVASAPVRSVVQQVADMASAVVRKQARRGK